MIYEYTCTNCEHDWEETQKITELPKTVCPNCEKETAKRLISSGTGFILKGGGWFRNGY